MYRDAALGHNEEEDIPRRSVHYEKAAFVKQRPS